MVTSTVDVQIIGRTLRLNCPSDQIEALNQSAAELNKRINDLKAKSQVTNVDQLIMTVALNICYELSQEQLKNQQYAENIEQRLRLLQGTIERALVEQSNHN